MSPGAGWRRREAAAVRAAHSGDKGAEPIARQPATGRALPTGGTMRGSSLPRPRAGGRRGAAHHRGHSSQQQQAGLPPPSSPRSRRRGCPGKSEPHWQRRARGSSCPQRTPPRPGAEARSSRVGAPSGRRATCGGARPRPGN